MTPAQLFPTREQQQLVDRCVPRKWPGEGSSHATEINTNLACLPATGEVRLPALGLNPSTGTEARKEGRREASKKDRDQQREA